MRRSSNLTDEDKEIYAVIGTNTKMYLMLKNHSQSELANLLGVSRASMSLKISGKIAWSASDVLKVSQFLNVPVERLYSREAVRSIAKAYGPIGNLQLA